MGENWLLPGGDEARAERLPDKCTIHLEAGDVLRMLTPGGGGWGTPDPGRELAFETLETPPPGTVSAATQEPSSQGS